MNTSNLKILRTLVAKDWRLFRVPMIALIICGIGVYLLATIAILEDARERGSAPQNQANRTGKVLEQSMVALELIVNGSIGGLVLTSLLSSALGGVAIAGERAERSSDFIGLLPVTRWQIILGKLTASLLMLSLFTAIHLLIAGACTFIHGRIHGGSSTPGGILLDPLAQGAIWWIGITICFFGVGWLLSTFTNSGPISACISIAVAAIAMVSTALLTSNHHVKDRELALISAAVGLGIGTPCLLGGTVYYLKRIAP